MKTRIVFGAIMIAVLAGVLYLDWAHQVAATTDMDWHSRLAEMPVGTLTAGIMVLLAVPAFREVARLAAASGVRILWVSGLLGTLSFALLPLLWQADAASATGPSVLMGIGLLVLAAFLEQMIRSGTDRAVGNLGATFLAMLYLGIGAAMMLQLRIQIGVPALVLFLAAVKCTDIGAYFTGSLIGRHKMIPKISPGKSWEGLAGGLAAAVGVTLLLRWVLKIEISVTFSVVFGVVIGVLGQFADLCESVMKRSAGVKDSGAVVPQFGGVLDILDSPLLTAPIAWLMLTFGTMP